MEQVIWLAIYIALGVGLVFGGFWVIARAGLPVWVKWLFGAIVLVAITFALVYLMRGWQGGPTLRL